MAVKRAKTVAHRRTLANVSLSREDERALARAEALGLSPAELLRRGLRIAAAPFYTAGRRSPRTRLFESTDPHLGEESHLFQALED